MSNEYEEIVALQLPILNVLMNDPKAYNLYGDSLRVSDFTLPECQLLFESLRHFRSRLPDNVPKARELVAAIYAVRSNEDSENHATDEHHEAVKAALQELFSGLAPEEYFMAALPDYVRKVRFAQLQSQQPYMSQDEYIAQMIELQNLVIGPGKLKDEHVLNPWDHLIYDEEDIVDTVPTGLPALDQVLGGGMRPGEFGVVTASSGVGKTNTLLNFAIKAATRGIYSLLFSLELSKETMAGRYHSMTTGIPYRLFSIPINKWEKDAYRFRRQLHHFRDLDKAHVVPPVQIYGMPSEMLTPKQIREHVLRWQDAVVAKVPDAKPLFVGVDWLEYVMPNPGSIKKRNPETHEILGKVAVDMQKDIAVETNVALWSAAQANRAATNKSSLTMADIGKSFAVNEPLDLHLGLTAPNDKDLEALNAKQHGEDDMAFAIKRIRRGLHANTMKIRRGTKVGFNICQNECLQFWENEQLCNRYAQDQENGNYRRFI